MDTRKQNKLEGSPVVLLGKEPPVDLGPVPKAHVELNYITFILFPTHYAGETKQERAISNIVNFRDYFHYHIKCCKTFMHTRIRGKVSDLLKMYNRTKPLMQNKRDEPQSQL